ncbi:hypothetical protein GGS21DRAFT_64090 [Xylaria nigripes]|nr:hypothetical protein GGS21DRAFT_64090 [Xylaria nigripes]
MCQLLYLIYHISSLLILFLMPLTLQVLWQTGDLTAGLPKDYYPKPRPPTIEPCIRTNHLKIEDGRSGPRKALYSQTHENITHSGWSDFFCLLPYLRSFGVRVV